MTHQPDRIPEGIFNLPYAGQAAEPSEAVFGGRSSQTIAFYITQMGILEQLAGEGVVEATTLIFDLDRIDPEAQPEAVDIALNHSFMVDREAPYPAEPQRRVRDLASMVSLIAKVATPAYAMTAEDSRVLREEAADLMGTYSGPGQEMLRDFLAKAATQRPIF